MLKLLSILASLFFPEFASLPSPSSQDLIYEEDVFRNQTFIDETLQYRVSFLNKNHVRIAVFPSRCSQGRGPSPSVSFVGIFAVRSSAGLGKATILEATGPSSDEGYSSRIWAWRIILSPCAKPEEKFCEAQSRIFEPVPGQRLKLNPLPED